MSKSASAILFWGIAYTNLDQDEFAESRRGKEDEEFVHFAVMMSAARDILDARETIDVPAPKRRTDPYAKHDPAYQRSLREYQEHRIEWRFSQCAFDWWGDADESDYFAAAPGSVFRVESNYALAIPDLPFRNDREAALRAFCEQIGAPWKHPMWWLVSRYG